MPTLADLDFASRHAATLRAAELEARHTEYLAQHTEYREVIHEFMQALLIHKPDDALTFMQEYFNAHREKTGSYQNK